MKGRSVNTNLVEFVNVATETMESRSQLDVVYTDFSKAFDCVDHKILIDKLSCIGIHSTLLDWLSSYLSHRKQYVSVSGFESEVFTVTSGVPQGSHLGPLLFILFINDVVQIFNHVKCLIYADDVKLFMPINDSIDVINFQNDLDRFYEWCIVNNLSLNVNKCKHLTFYRKTVPHIANFYLGVNQITTVDEIRDLGVHFTRNLSFSRHIELVVSKSLSMLGFLKRICFDFRNIECLKCIYYAFVRSHLEFACVVWSPDYNIHSARLESVQKQFVKYALRHLYRRSTDSYVLPSYSSRCESLRIQSLSNRRDDICSMFIYDVITDKINSAAILGKLDFHAPSRSLRNHLVFRPKNSRTNYARSEPVRRACTIFNSVSSLFDFNVSRFVFKKRLKCRDT